jgi:hypothetical protein
MVMGAPMSKAARTRQVVLDLLHQHKADGALPTSIRFVFYELEQAGDATKPDPNDTRPNKRRSIGWPPGELDVIRAVTDLRESDTVPWAWIVDETRRLDEWLYADTVIGYMLGRLPEATINPWGSEPPPLIICESRATAGVLRDTVSQYVCPITGTAGQANGFLRTRVASLLKGDGIRRPVLYLGDLDLSGGHIEINTQRVLERAAGREIEWIRLGMTEAQAQARGITPILKTDGRTKKTHRAIEVEALGQAGVVALVRDALDARLPEPLDDVLEREREQADPVEAVLTHMREVGAEQVLAKLGLVD